jgi:hypothetical protein
MKRPFELLVLLLVLCSLVFGNAGAEETATPPPPSASAAAPADAQTLRQQALDHWQTDEREQAIALLDQAIAHFPDDVAN